MLRKPVESSSLKSVGYDIVDGNLVLEVEFARGAVYHYYQVSYDVYEQLMSAESVGSYFSKNIQKKYQFKKVSE
jgi:hypothetical protein